MDPWIPDHLAWLPGTVLGAGFGTIGGVYGALAGSLAPRGIGRAWVLGAHVILFALGVAILTLGVVALIVGQPFHVWFWLVQPGFLITVLMGVLYPVIVRRYAQAEHRKLDAEALRRS